MFEYFSFIRVLILLITLMLVFLSLYNFDTQMVHWNTWQKNVIIGTGFWKSIAIIFFVQSSSETDIINHNYVKLCAFICLRFIVSSLKSLAIFLKLSLGRRCLPMWKVAPGESPGKDLGFYSSHPSRFKNDKEDL